MVSAPGTRSLPSQGPASRRGGQPIGCYHKSQCPVLPWSYLSGNVGARFQEKWPSSRYQIMSTRGRGTALYWEDPRIHSTFLMPLPLADTGYLWNGRTLAQVNSLVSYLSCLRAELELLTPKTFPPTHHQNKGKSSVCARRFWPGSAWANPESPFSCPFQDNPTMSTCFSILP